MECLPHQVQAENSVALEAERYAAAAQHALAHAGPPPRDTTYVGLHAPPPDALGLRLSKAGVVTGVFEALEVYESIRAHKWQVGVVNCPLIASSSGRTSGRRVLHDSSPSMHVLTTARGPFPTGACFMAPRAALGVVPVLFGGGACGAARSISRALSDRLVDRPRRLHLRLPRRPTTAPPNGRSALAPNSAPAQGERRRRPTRRPARRAVGGDAPAGIERCRGRARRVVEWRPRQRRHVGR